MPCAYCGEETHAAPICFKRLRAEVSLTEVLDRYGVELVKLRTQCPLPGHQGERKNKPFSVKEDGRAFHCWSCGAKGNVLEFVRLMERLDKASDAGKKLAEWFPADGVGVKPNVRPEVPLAPTPVQVKPGRNVPLNEKWATVRPALLNVHPDHPYLQARGFSLELCMAFGVGVYLGKGPTMKNRVVFPIHNLAGQLLAYAGRLTDDSAVSENNPRWKFPRDFHKGLELFNLETRAAVFFRELRQLFGLGVHLIRDMQKGDLSVYIKYEKKGQHKNQDNDLSDAFHRIFSTARSLALRARGFPSISSGAACTGFLVKRTASFA